LKEPALGLPKELRLKLFRKSISLAQGDMPRRQARHTARHTAENEIFLVDVGELDARKGHRGKDDALKGIATSPDRVTAQDRSATVRLWHKSMASRPCWARARRQSAFAAVRPSLWMAAPGW